MKRQRRWGATWRDSGSVSTWQSATGQDAAPSAYVANANLSPAGVPQAGSPVIGVGANLTSLSILTLNKDIIGNPRLPVGAWTVGAYSTSGTAPQPPTGLTGTVVTN